MISYITQVTICWGLFYALYTLWLRKETFFNTNRWYLLITLIAGLTIPLIEFQTPFIAGNIETHDPAFYLETITVTAQSLEANLEEIVITPVNESWSMQFILLSIYWLGVLFFASRFAYGMFQIIRLAYTGKITQKQQYFLVETDKVHLPFSFMNFMFWSKAVEFNQEDHKKILRHELSHIKGNHSIDVLITELLCIFLWCSPFIFLYKKALKNIHEYLADDAVLKDTPTRKYGQLLLKQSQSGLQIAQANNFIHSQLKKRIIMMTKTKSQRYSLLKYTAILPLALLLVFSISAKDSMAESKIDRSSLISLEQDTLPETPMAVTNEVFQVVEEMPRFMGCEEIKDKMERKACADQKMLMHIYSNIKYPATARKSNIEGTVVVSFIIEKNGEISQPTILRKIGGGCDEEVLRIVEEMPDFVPGKQRGKAVRVKYNLPVKFKLEGETKDKKAGISTKNLPTEALVIIDGKEANSVDNIDPNDIKEINVLKGEAAFKKYGDKAKNGVVEITTLKADINVVGYANKSIPPPPPPVLEDNQILRVAEQMPMFPGTTDRESSNKALLTYIYQNLKYPASAVAQGIEGTTVVNFIVTKKGTIKDAKILRSIGGGTDEAVLLVTNSMNDLPERWTPGMQSGKVVSVSFNLPVKFKLDPKASSDKKAKTDQELMNDVMEGGKDSQQKKPIGLEVLDLYPNPSSGNLNIRWTSKIKAPSTLTISDSSGKQIYKKSFEDQEVNLTDLDLKNATNGLLIISLEQGGKVITKEVILQK